MTPKQKAEKLVDNYLTASFGVMEEYIPVPMVLAKQCALIAVEEIISAYPHTYDMEKKSTKDGEDIFIIMNVRSNIGYWHEVKQEIEKL